ncbi:MAG: hypothetical protein ABIH58_05390, partial [Patescibacteria group bacterium]
KLAGGQGFACPQNNFANPLIGDVPKAEPISGCNPRPDRQNAGGILPIVLGGKEARRVCTLVFSAMLGDETIFMNIPIMMHSSKVAKRPFLNICSK